MAPISRNDVAGHLKSRIDWQAIVLSYCGRKDREVPEEVRRAVIDNRSEAYRMAELLGIDLDKYDRGR